MKDKKCGVTAAAPQSSAEGGINGQGFSASQTVAVAARVEKDRLFERLFTEAMARGLGLLETAGELGVSPGRLLELGAGSGGHGEKSPDFISACARFLGVPAIVVKLIAGIVTSADFVGPQQTQEEILDRALRRMSSDPMVGEYLLPLDLSNLQFEAKKAIATMYADFTGDDVFALAELPVTLQLLQRAAACANRTPEPEASDLEA